MKKRTLLLIIIVSLCLSCLPFSALGSTGITVWLDGEYITFDDADPTIMNGRTMVPFRKILEKIGATVTYDKSTKVIGASRRGVSLSLKAGNSALNVTKDGKTVAKHMDAPPVVTSGGRTLVPIRHILESLGLYVSWDKGAKTVIIVDVPALAEKYIGDYGVLSSLEKASYAGEYFKNTGSARYLMEISGADGMSDKLTALSVDGTFDVVAKGANYSGTMKSSLVLPIPGFSGGEAVPSTDTLIYDGASSTLFIKPQNNVALFGEAFPGFDQDTYIRIDEEALWGHVFPEAISGELIALLSFDQNLLLRDFLEKSFYDACAGFDSLENVAFTNEALKNIVGDAMFYRERTGGADENISLRLSAAKILSAYKSAYDKYPSLPFALTEYEKAKELFSNDRAISLAGDYQIYGGSLSFTLDANAFIAGLTDSRVEKKLYKSGARYSNYVSKIYMGSYVATYMGTKSYEVSPLSSASVTAPPSKFKALDLMDILALIE